MRSRVHRAGQRRHDERRRRQEFTHLLLHATFEVTVAAQDGRDDQVVGVDRADIVWQRTAVADAGRAAVAHQVESELVEILVEPRLRQVIGHDLRTGRQTGLHPRLARQAFSTAFFATRPAPIITLGFEVFVQLVIAAITTSPCE